MRFLAFALLFAFALVGPVRGQESDDVSGGGYGYTSINYDSDTNTVTVYAETDVDPSDYGYYSVEISTSIRDSNGTVQGNAKQIPGCAVDSSGDVPATVSCQFAAQPNDVYTALSSHFVDNYVYDVADGHQYVYDDVDGYDTFASADYEAPFATVYTPPYYLIQTRSQRVPLGQTTDSKGSTAQPVCGDVRDTLLTEYYKSPGTSFRPSCEDFVSPAT